MTRDQAIKYIKKVLKTWHAFNRSHRLMFQALTLIVNDYDNFTYVDTDSIKLTNDQVKRLLNARYGKNAIRPDTHNAKYK